MPNVVYLEGAKLATFEDRDNPMTNCSLILVALFLIGLGLGDSPIVILSLCSLVLFFVISFCLLCLFYCFFFCFSLCLCPSLYSLVCLMFS